MRILFLSDDFPPQSFGGAGISTYELASGMKNAGHEVFVITTCRDVGEAGESEYEGLKIFKIASNYPGKWRWYVSLYNRPVLRQVEILMKKIKPDVVHANNVHLHLSYHSLVVSKRNARIVAWTGRDVMAFSFSKLQTKRYLENLDSRTTWLDHFMQAKKRWNPLRNFFIRRYLGFADIKFAVSNALVVALRKHGINNVEVMHTGINANLWRVDVTQAEKYRQRYGLKGKKVILFGGRLSEAKGGKIALDVMAKIAKSEPSAVLLIVSKVDGYTDHLKQEADKLGIGERLIFTGWTDRNDIKYVYSCADVVFVPSVCFDAFPRIVLEAMAAGKPVISTRYGGVVEIIVDGVTGYIVDPFNLDEVVTKVSDILRDHKKLEAMGRAGYDRVVTDFNSADKINMILARYRELMARG